MSRKLYASEWRAAVEQARAGSFDALDRIARPILGVIARRISPAWEADLVQIALVKIWTRVDRIDVARETGIQSYILTIGERAMRDEARTQRIAKGPDAFDGEDMEVPSRETPPAPECVRGSITEICVRSIRCRGNVPDAIRATANRTHMSVHDVRRRIREEIGLGAAEVGSKLPTWMSDEDVVASIRSRSTRVPAMAKHIDGQKALPVERVPLASLRADSGNVRKHDRRNLDAIRASLSQFGQQKPIVVDAEGVVLAGNGTLAASAELGWTHIDVVRSKLRGAEALAFAIADNRTTDLSEFDGDALAIAMAEISKDAPLLLESTGFLEDEVRRMLGRLATQERDAETTPALPDTPIAQAGDTWIMGRHRLCCGDSTSRRDVERLLGGNKPKLMVTDPPYGVEYDPAWRAEAGVNKNKAKLGKVRNDERADWTEAWRLFPGDVAYVYHADTLSSVVLGSLEACDFKARAQIIWAKDRMALSRGDYHWQHEPCWYVVRDGKKACRTDDRSQTTLWTIDSREDSGHGHGTQKPVECMERPMRNHTFTQVYDPFGGSGTTAIAAERLGRDAFLMEIDPRYCDVIVRRWEEFTGKKAERKTA